MMSIMITKSSNVCLLTLDSFKGKKHDNLGKQPLIRRRQKPRKCSEIVVLTFEIKLLRDITFGENKIGAFEDLFCLDQPYLVEHFQILFSGEGIFIGLQ